MLGQNVSLNTLLVNPEYMVIVWNFNNGETQVSIATQAQTFLTVNEDLYKDRVSVDTITGRLTLTGLRATDSGDYSINVVMVDGTTSTDEIQLRVLGE